MGKLVSSSGGTARNKIYEKWKASKWTVHLYENEVVSTKKRKTENENVIIQSKRRKIFKAEEDLKVANKKLKEITNQYQTLKKSCNSLSKALKNKGTEPSQPGKDKTKKPWELCTRQYRKTRTKEVIQNINTALSYTEDQNFKPVQVQIMNKSTGSKVTCWAVENL